MQSKLLSIGVELEKGWLKGRLMMDKFILHVFFKCILG